jgi:hypothetical protein
MIPGKKLVEVRCALTPLQHHLYGAILKKNYKQLNHGNRTGIASLGGTESMPLPTVGLCFLTVCQPYTLARVDRVLVNGLVQDK